MKPLAPQSPIWALTKKKPKVWSHFPNLVRIPPRVYYYSLDWWFFVFLLVNFFCLFNRVPKKGISILNYQWGPRIPYRPTWVSISFPWFIMRGLCGQTPSTSKIHLVFLVTHFLEIWTALLITFFPERNLPLPLRCNIAFRAIYCGILLVDLWFPTDYVCFRFV